MESLSNKTVFSQTVEVAKLKLKIEKKTISIRSLKEANDLLHSLWHEMHPKEKISEASEELIKDLVSKSIKESQKNAELQSALKEIVLAVGGITGRRQSVESLYQNSLKETWSLDSKN